MSINGEPVIAAAAAAAVASPVQLPAARGAPSARPTQHLLPYAQSLQLTGLSCNDSCCCQ